MDNRAQFEAWFRSKHEGQMITKGKGYSDPITQLMWQAWQESRAAIEVELPEKISKLNTTDNGLALPEAASYDEAIDDCAEAIRAIGISIKGEA